MVLAENQYTRVLPFLLAVTVGVLTTADPYISTQLSNYIPYSLAKYTGIKIPYLFTALLLGVVFFVSIVFYAIRKIVRYDIRKVFIICYLIGVHTVALSPVSKLNGGNLTLLAFFILFFINIFVSKNKFRIILMDFFNLMLFASLTLSLVNGFIPQPVSTLFTAGLLVVLSFLLVNYSSDKEIIKFIIKWFIIFSCISAVIGIMQEALYPLLKVPLIGFVKHKELQHMYETTSLGRLLRVPAFTGTYAFLAFFLVSSLIMSLNILFYKALDLKTRVKLWSAVIIISIGIIFTFSRVALMAIGVVIPLNIIVRWHKYIFHMIAGLIICLCIMYVAIYFDFNIYGKVYDKVAKEAQWGEFRQRLQLDREGIYGFVGQHPWIGRGAGMAQKYASHFFGWGAHNAIIRAADDVGILGLVPYLALIVYSFFNVTVINLSVRLPEDKAIARGLMFSFLAIVIMSQFDSVYLGVVFWFFMALIKAAEIIYTNPIYDNSGRTLGV